MHSIIRLSPGFCNPVREAFKVSLTRQSRLRGPYNVLWGSDFPHPDGVWPDSQEYLQRQLGHLPDSQRRKVVYENAAKLYGFPIPQ